MCTTEDISKLRDSCVALLNECLRDIKSHRKKTAPENEKCLISGEYLLLEAEEYVNTTWTMILSEKYNASLSLSRWILEASLNFFWVVSENEKKDDRLITLYGEALRSEANLQDGLAVLIPEKSGVCKINAENLRKLRESLEVNKLKSLEQRLKTIKLQSKFLYPLYRICCRFAHPSLRIWERMNQTVPKESMKPKSNAILVATSSIYYLVMATYCLVDLGNKEQLRTWWEKKVRPLL